MVVHVLGDRVWRGVQRTLSYRRRESGLQDVNTFWTFHLVFNDKDGTGDKRP